MRKRKKKPSRDDFCPICQKLYKARGGKTKHHVFPKLYYKIGLTVPVCREDHDLFNKKYPMKSKWSMETCLSNWINFCHSHDVHVFTSYPQVYNFKLPKG